MKCESIMKTDSSTKIIGVSLPLEVATFGSQCSLEEFIIESSHILVVPNIDLQDLHQNPCQVDSTHSEAERYTSLKKRT